MAQNFTKSAAAFMLSFDLLRQISESGLYFWTFTAAHASTDIQFARAWTNFNRRINYAFNMSVCGLRVFERHTSDGPRNGMLHAHVVCNRRLYIRHVRRLAICTGIGQVMKVGKAWDGLEHYLCKYMTKEGRLRGVRQWAAFGHWDHCLVSNVEVQSEEANLYRSVAAEYRAEPHAWTKTAGRVAQIKFERATMHSASSLLTSASLAGDALVEMHSASELAGNPF